ncbi:MAG: hypothetical protein CSA22_00770 [Deltaproteobacteria bacterium]|nr:MAG: hypothetical protein CSA22_00770 [Deltaproteobacteria bacterium]
MTRENYFILLELQVDPPETDAQVIEAAITKKQAEWSRLRNHPTKGTQAKQLIGMISDIRKVMLDDVLRDEEAVRASKAAERQEAESFAEVDRFIDILMSKGGISKEEIFNLAKKTGLEPKAVQGRIAKKMKEKTALLDRHIETRSAKGFMTPDEITTLSQTHGLPEKMIRKRITVPIQKGKSGFQTEPESRLAKSIEKGIADNLKIVGKSSLYDFLGLSPLATLEELQQQALAVKADYDRMAKKDATTTAGIVLTGHCMTLFKTAEARRMYDQARVASRLEELDGDIDIAGMGGKIKPGTFRELMKRAESIGMDPDAAEAYITDYCRKRKWKLNTGSVSRRPAYFFLILLCVLVAAGVLVITSLFLLRSKQMAAREFENLLIQVEETQDLEQKRKLLMRYADVYGDTENGKIASARADILTRKIARKSFEAANSAVDELVAAGSFEAADQRLSAAIKQLAGNPDVGKLKKKRESIAQAADDQAFDTINEKRLTLGSDDRIEMYMRYLHRFPKGRHVSEVRAYIDEMREEYYMFIEKTVNLFAEKQEWETAYLLSARYLEVYKENHRHTEKMEKLRQKYQFRRRDAEVLEALDEKAAALGKDYVAAKAIYADHLKAYPYSDEWLQKTLANRLKEKDRQIEGQRIAAARAVVMNQFSAAARSRFTVQNADVLLDGKTGLMWTLLDSSQIRQTCLSFDDAKDYTKALAFGGYTDWRLPTQQELAGIFRTAPVFPVEDESRWYWSSTQFSSYADGWTHIVSVLSPDGRKNGKIDSRECGSVLAVRTP